MTHDIFIRILKQYDHPVCDPYPPDMDYEKQVSRSTEFVLQLQQRLNTNLEVETGCYIQDASFHSQVKVDEQWLRFSNFGNLIATTEDNLLYPETLEIIKELADENDFVFIPNEVLDEEYSGDHPDDIDGAGWWIRYFDWV